MARRTTKSRENSRHRPSSLLFLPLAALYSPEKEQENPCFFISIERDTIVNVVVNSISNERREKEKNLALLLLLIFIK